MNLWYRQVYLVSPHWKELRARKLRRNPCCELCRSREHLDVHHLEYSELYDIRLAQLRTLCRQCHKLQHSKLSDSQIIERERQIVDATKRALKAFQRDKLKALKRQKNKYDTEKGFAQPRKKWDSLTQEERYARFYRG